MAKQRSIEIKVGIFVLLCLAIGAGLVIKFGKLERFSSETYDITVIFPNVGGIVRDANVMYAGIPIGKVRDIKLTEQGALKVRVTLAIYKGYAIRSDAKFVLHAATAVVIAVALEGLFEVNLGDSEVLGMFLAVAGCGYAALEKVNGYERTVPPAPRPAQA